MINEIKDIKFKELKKEMEQYEKVKENIEKRKKDISNDIKELENKYNSQMLVPNHKFSWIQKHITKRKEYKESINRTKDYLETYKLMEELKKELEEIKKSEKNNKDIKKLYELKEKFDEIKEAKTIEELGLNFAEARELLKENGIKIKLSKEDIFVEDKENKQVNYKGLEDFILVRKTNNLPVNSRVQSAKEANSMEYLEITLNGNKYETQYPKPRNTVHFAVNHEVKSHSMGEWENCKYAILVPFKDIKKDTIGFAQSVDTFIVGGVDLTSNSWILCPDGEKEQIEKNNPGVQIIEYDGENVNGYANTLVHNLGYKVEKGKDFYFDNKIAQKQFRDIMNNEKIKVGHHSNTKYRIEEEIEADVNMVAAVFKIIKDNKLVNNIDEVIAMSKQLEQIEDKKYSNSNRKKCFYSSGLKNEIKKVIMDEESRKLLYIELNKQGIDIDISYYEELLEGYEKQLERENKSYDIKKELLQSAIQGIILREIQNSIIKEQENKEKNVDDYNR